MNGAAIPGQVLVRLRPGVDPGTAPSHRDVLDGHRAPALALDRGPADRALRRHSRTGMVTRVHQAARAAGAAGHRGEGWDDLERELGFPRLLRVQVHPEVSLPHLVEDLRGCETVESAVPNRLVRTPFARAEAAGAGDPFARIGHARALEMEPGDPALIVGVVDSGVSLSHPEFTGRLRPGLNMVDVADGSPPGLRLIGDWRYRDRTPNDENGHGSGCAGIIGARGLGVPPGLAGEARLLPIRVLAAALELADGAPTAIGCLADIDAGFKAAIDLGARVLNLSFGTPESDLAPEDPVPHADLVRYALARDCLLVAAAGNSGDRQRYFPACLPGVIAVGAVDGHDRPAGFTTRGPHVLISAPGTDIPTVGISGYRGMSGTSFSAPFVAAAGALLMSRAARRSAWLPPAAARHALAAAARPFPHPAEGCGAGILDVPAALTAADDLISDPLAEDLHESITA